MPTLETFLLPARPYFASVSPPQALHFTPGFRQEMVGAAAPHLPLLSSLRDLLLHLDTTSCLTISPRDFLTASRPAWFEEGEQQDCSEYLTALLASLQEEQEEGKVEAGESPVRRVFGGRMETSHTCHSCSSVSTSTSWFTDLHLPFPDPEVEVQRSVAASLLANLPSISISWTAPTAPLALPAMLQAALATETLTGDNQYQCDTCGGLRDATKALKLVAAPRVLVLVLLRFKYDGETQSRRKLVRVVEYPEALAVEVAGVQVDYLLESVVVHSGTESGEGHYFAMARSPRAQVGGDS